MNWKEYWNEGAAVRADDFCKQVGRTINKRNYSEREIAILMDRILYFLRASPEKALLELACGNGMITSRLAPHFKSITAIDFSDPLIRTAKTNFARDNIRYVVDDATELKSVVGEFDCVLLYFAFQYFSAAEACRMFQRLKRLLRPGGRVLLGEVADGDRIWNFYRGLRGRSRYAYDQLRGKPIIGHWWKATELLKLAEEIGWHLSIFYQDQSLPNHYFRYDALLESEVQQYAKRS